MTAPETKALNRLASFGYGVYGLPNGRIAVADPLDSEDGFYLEVESLEEAEREIADWMPPEWWEDNDA